MKRIFLISVLLILIFTCLPGEIVQVDGKDVIAYWSFNENTTSGVANDNNERFADEGNGKMHCSFPGNDVVNGSDINVLSLYDRGRGIGFTKNDNGKTPYWDTEEIRVEFSTEYYKNITISYALLCGESADTKHKIYYSQDGINYILYSKTGMNPYKPLLDDKYHLVNFELDNAAIVNNQSTVLVKIELWDWFPDLKKTRFDNFLITGTPIHHFIPNRPNTIDNTTITFAQGMADEIEDPEDIPSLPNPNIAADEMESLALDLKGEGPWYLTLQNVKEYCAYHRGDTWVEVDKSDEGFKIEIEAPTNRSANKLFIVFSTQQPTLPIELSSFSVSTTPGSAPKIAWETASETALNGYYVLRSESPHLTSAEIISPLIFAQNSSFYTTYKHEDKTAIAGKKYYYWLHVLELNQADSYAGPIVLHCPEEETQQPEPIYPLTKIRDIYPNPFNPSTNVCFELAQDNEVSFKIYNLRGKEVLRLDSRQYSKGLHHISIDSKTHDGRELPAGVYLLKMDAGGNSYLRKMTLLK